MTEEEARTRWCPFAASRTVTFPVSATDNKTISAHLAGSEPDTTCIGSACMAWRGVSLPKGRAMTPQGEIVSTAAAKRFGWTVTTHGDGYCGLAGAPQ